MQLPMDLTHELMKMDSDLFGDWGCFIKAIHQKRFAPTNSAPEINAPGQLGVEKFLGQGITTDLFVSNPLIFTLL